MTRADKSELATETARQALWQALRSGQLRDGQFLSMPQLVELLACPIAAIREAVRLACSQGLLTTLPKRGVQVMEVTPEVIRRCLDCRMAMDQEGARRRIARGDLPHLAPLRDAHEAMLNAALSGDMANLPPLAIQVDLSLHDYLASGLQNPWLEQAYEANRMRIAIIQNARPFLPDRVHSAMQEHLDILAALEARDGGRVESAIATHYRNTLRWWGAGQERDA
ncbi:GntR family transcriptional regulator [Arenibacterium sp. LLYu02]|uniref:GntR family transcriptional regulator n=1 Tax=Arenibacterium sp. LLYu02 TaxID=3404132 RepID=UPI003B21C7FA